jgi:hypothetical protein
MAVKAKKAAAAESATNGANGATPLTKPTKFSLKDFATEQNPSKPGVEPTTPALSLMRLAEVKDFFLLHPDEENYWSVEVALIHVPTKGSKETTLHLILDSIVQKHSDVLRARVKYCRIALGSKPDNVFFLAMIPTRNLDNKYNAAAIRGAVQAKSGTWTILTSRKADGCDDYAVGKAKNNEAALPIKWPHESLDEIFETSIGDKFIKTEEHTALDRLLMRTMKLEP